MGLIVQNFVDFFKSLTMLRRIALIGMVGVLLSAMAGIIVFSSKTDYKVLYTDLTKDDSATIARMLETGKISYQVNKEGNGVFVFILSGSAVVNGQVLKNRDAVGISDTDKIDLRALENSEVLLMEVPMSGMNA